MKTLVTRSLLGAGALAIPLAASLALPTAAAHAAPPQGMTTATATMGTGPHPFNGTINGNLDVPAGVALYVNGAEVTGNVTVEGYLFAANATFDKNVIVDGGHIQFDNQPSTVKNNLNVTNSPNSDVNGFWATTTIGNNFNYIGNAAHLFVGATLNVGNQTNIA
jgi:hypothetical protein